MPELSEYHKRCLTQARNRVAELGLKSTAQMTADDARMWLIRMECTAVDLLNIVDLLLDKDAREVRDDR